MLRWWLVLTVLIFLPGPASAAPVPAPVQATEELAYRAPLVAIVADPARFNGHRVETTGYLVFGGELPHLYIARDDAKTGQILNGVSLIGPDAFDRSTRGGLNQRVVWVRGTFHWGRYGDVGYLHGLLVADTVEVWDLASPLGYFHEFPVSVPGPFGDIVLPWLWVMAALFATTLGIGGWQIRASRTGGNGPDKWVWKGLVAAWSVFTLIEAGNALEIFRLTGPYWPPGWTFKLVVLIVGIIGLAGMWLALWRRQLTLCLAFMALQFLVPATREVVRFDTWQAQLAYPFYPDIENAKWERTEPAPPNRPHPVFGDYSWEKALRPQDSD